MNGVLTAVLTLIQQLLPLLGTTTKSAQAANVVTSIIAALVEFAPLIKKEITTVYGAVVGIIAALRGVTSVPEQLAALDAFEADIDAAWAAVETKLDPDAG